MFTIMKKTAHIFSDRFQDLKRPKIGPCQENDSFAQKTTQDLAGASSAVCTLPMVPCGSSPVTRFALASAMRKMKRLRRRLVFTCLQ